jgi:hypothetical protein
MIQRTNIYKKLTTNNTKTNLIRNDGTEIGFASNSYAKKY